jgi:hypothetical protein
MKYLRLGTYTLFLVVVVMVWRSRTRVVPVDLAPPVYNVQVSELLRGVKAAQALKSPLLISGGLPEGVEWIRNDGPDFSVWTARYGVPHSRLSVGVYVGHHPQVAPPSNGLERGYVGVIPVLWWKHFDEAYRTSWDAIIPTADGEYVHVWISDFDPKNVQTAAEMLKNLKLYE